LTRTHPSVGTQRFLEIVTKKNFLSTRRIGDPAAMFSPDRPSILRARLMQSAASDAYVEVARLVLVEFVLEGIRFVRNEIKMSLLLEYL
jgi:hypothetical protein